ncbi:MAG: MFS transporter [Firmicutes bacterium]|nr:MFS transporter [Bacillota bacterium]
MNKTSKQGIVVVIAALAIQLTLGIAYLWTLFQTGITNDLFNEQNHLAALTFSVVLACLTIGSVFGGMLAKKLNSTRIVVFIGGSTVALGFLLASFVTDKAPWLLYFTYGLMGGTGMGLSYSTTIACAQKWFPHKKGLITGIIISALGFGGVVFTPVILAVLSAFGAHWEMIDGINTFVSNDSWRWTFRVLAGAFFVICGTGSYFLKNAPQPQTQDPLPADLNLNQDQLAKSEQKPEGVLAENEAVKEPIKNAVTEPAKATIEKKDYTAVQMLKSPKFYIIMATFFFAVIGGQMMIAFASPIESIGNTGLPIPIGALTLSIGILAISFFNSAGRLLWGFLSDKLGRINTILILLAGSAALLMFVGLAAGHWTIYILMAAIGLFYGGILSIFPTLTAENFGTKNLATNYGFILLGFGGGAIVAGQVAGIFANQAVQHNDVNKMFPAFIIGAVCAVAGIGLMVLLKFLQKNAKKKLDLIKMEAETKEEFENI